MRQVEAAGLLKLFIRELPTPLLTHTHLSTYRSVLGTPTHTDTHTHCDGSIRDDYANLTSREYSESKSFCEDLTEGKFSFPTIHAIWSQPESTQVQNILRQRTDNVDIKRYCVDYLEKVGSFAYTRQTLRDLEAEVYRLIGEFGGNPQLESLVKHLSRMHREPEATAESRMEPRSSRIH